MKFYEIDNALVEAIEAGNKPLRVRIDIDFTGDGSFESVFEQDIVEADFYGLKEAAGGTSARGEVLLNNSQGIYAYIGTWHVGLMNSTAYSGNNGAYAVSHLSEGHAQRFACGNGAGTQVKVSFSLGEGLPWFERFIFYIDDNGIQDIRGPGRKRFVRLGLRDLSAKLRKTDEARDWTAPAVFTYGTTTVGSQYLWDNDDPGEPLVPLMFEMKIPVNKFLVSETINGTLTAYAYTNEDDYDAGGRPVLYSDNGNKPKYRKSANENLFDLRVTGSKPKGWRSAAFSSNGSIASGSYIWFGVFVDGYWFPRFDYGARCYTDWWWDYGMEDTVIPGEYPLYNANYYEDFKLSMYFTYTSAQNYTRTLTQGITLTDTRKVTGNYKRTTAQTVRGTTAVTGLESFYRGIVQTVKNTMTVKASPTLIRKLIQQTGASDTAKRFLSILRKPAQTAGINSGTQRITQANRTIADTGKPGTVIGRKQDFTRNIVHTGNAGIEVLKRAEYVKRFQETAGSTAGTGVVRDVVLRLAEAVAAIYDMKAGTGFSRSVTDTVKNSSVMGGMVAFFRILSGYAGNGDSTSSFITRMRVIQDTGTVGDDTGHTADYLRGLFVEAGTMAEIKDKAEYHRKQQDTAGSEAVSLRHLFIFIRLITGAYIRDFIIGRFLKSREEIVIKSPVCRELILDSKVH
jgi:hypothetical protein